MSAGRLAGKVALVTGAARGIGAAIARAFAAEGARVVLTYRASEAKAHALAEEIGGTALALDVAARASVVAALERTLELHGTLDVLVNNAGILEQKPFLEITDEDWDEMLAVNLKGVFLCTQEAARRLESDRGASIINLSSVGGQIGGPKAPHYSAAKAAVLALTRSTARLLAPRGIRVNAIAPGFIHTDMYEEIRQRTDEREILAAIPLGRVGQPEDVARAAVYLAAADSDFVTGQVLSVNGGQYMA